MTNDITQLVPLLKNGISHLQQLNKLLQEEVDAITGNDLEQLELVISRKKSALIEFAKCKDEWSRIISSRGHSVEEFSSSLPQAAREIILNTWAILEQENETLQKANQRNSSLVASRSRQLGHLLSALKGHQVKHQLYSGEGDRNNYQAQSSLGKA